MGELINGRTPEEIKGWMRCCSVMTSCYDCPYNRNDYCVSEAVLPNALAYIQHLEAQQPKWISVKDRLPEDCEWVLAYYGNFHGNIMSILQRKDDMWLDEMRTREPDYAITHWMPLPSAPEGE